MATNTETADKSAKKLTGNYEVTIGDDHKVILSPPNRFVIQAALSKMTKVSGEMDMIGAGEIVFNSCKIKCDAEIMENEHLLVGVFLQCAQLIEFAEATIKKI